MFLLRSFNKPNNNFIKTSFSRRFFMTTDQLGLSYITHSHLEKPILNFLYDNSPNLENRTLLCFNPQEKVKLFEGFFKNNKNNNLHKLNIYYECDKSNDRNHFVKIGSSKKKITDTKCAREKLFSQMYKKELNINIYSKDAIHNDYLIIDKDNLTNSMNNHVQLKTKNVILPKNIKIIWLPLVKFECDLILTTTKIQDTSNLLVTNMNVIRHNKKEIDDFCKTFLLKIKK